MPTADSPAPERNDDHITALVVRYQTYVRSLARRLAPSLADSDDIAQETFLVLLRRREQYDLEREARPLLAAIVRNLAKQAWERAMRDNRRRRDDLAHYLESMSDNEPSSTEAWTREALDGCLGKLSARERDLLHLRYTADCQSDEIAERLRSSGDAVRMALTRLRSRLRACIERTIGESPT